MILGQKLKTPTGIEVALYPGKTMNLSQGVDGAYSHSGTFEWDDAGEDSGIDRRYAFATLKCVYKDIGGGNGVNWHTVNPVLCADGVVRHLTFRVVHDNYIGDVKVGDIKQQGESIGHEGTAGMATGNHSHFNIAEGHIVGQGLAKNRYGVYELLHEIEPWRVFFVDNTVLQKTLGYPFKTYAQYLNGLKNQVTVNGLNITVVKEVIKTIEPAIDETFHTLNGIVITVKKAEVIK